MNCFTVPPPLLLHPLTLLPPEETREDFSDLADLGIVDVVGDDKGGRKIIVVSACRLPGNKGFDNQRFLRYLALLTAVFDNIWKASKILMVILNLVIILSLFLARYLMATLDQYVDMDYSLVYFHHGLTSRYCHTRKSL